jgi:hypothetical protein
MRHPLYVGSFLMGLGVTLMALPWGFVPLYIAVFLAMYVPKAIREEAHLKGLFGDAYATYSNAVGAVFPHRKHATAPDPVPSRFEWSRVRRHREWHTWIGVAAVLASVWLPSILWP